LESTDPRVTDPGGVPGGTQEIHFRKKFSLLSQNLFDPPGGAYSNLAPRPIMMGGVSAVTHLLFIAASV